MAKEWGGRKKERDQDDQDVARKRRKGFPGEVHNKSGTKKFVFKESVKKKKQDVVGIPQRVFR